MWQAENFIVLRKKFRNVTGTLRFRISFFFFFFIDDFAGVTKLCGSAGGGDVAAITFSTGQ